MVRMDLFAGTRLSLILSLLLSGSLFAAEDTNRSWQPDEKLGGLAGLFEPPNVRQITVGQNGCADFNSIQKAVDSVPKENSERVVILIKPGFFKQRVLVPLNKPFITFRGEDPFKTIISYDLNAQMTMPDGFRTYGSDCATFRAKGASDLILENLTIENTFGPHPQAQAVKLASERAICVNCRFLGGQDTIMTHSGRQFFLNCYIEGGTDFIYGHAQAVFENCRIHSNESSHITAHAATEPNLPTGYVFYNCRLTTGEGVVTDLGRPWRPYSRVVYYNCWMDKGIIPEGWDNWRNPANEKTAFYAEYKSRGPGADPAARVKWSHQLTDEQAIVYIPENFLRLNGQTIDNWLQKIIDFRKSSVCSSGP